MITSSEYCYEPNLNCKQIRDKKNWIFWYQRQRGCLKPGHQETTTQYETRNSKNLIHHVSGCPSHIQKVILINAFHYDRQKTFGHLHDFLHVFLPFQNRAVFSWQLRVCLVNFTNFVLDLFTWKKAYLAEISWSSRTLARVLPSLLMVL